MTSPTGPLPGGHLPPSGTDSPRPVVLIVDDSPIDRRLVGSLVERDLAMQPIYATNGTEALELLQRHEPVAILTDIQMQKMDGLELVDYVRKMRPLIPVVVMTAYGSEELVIRALRRGAASYLPKRNLARDLVSTVEQVVAAARAEQRDHRMRDCLISLDYHFVLGNDATIIPAVVAYFQDQLFRQQLCDEAGRTRVGIALEEALLNGLYHGNLELSSDLRQVDDTEFYRLGRERSTQPPYQSRRLFLDVRMSPCEAVFVVRDEGPGFDPGKLPDPTDPDNFGLVSGRGLLLIRSFMDDVRYNASGNEITMVKRCSTELEPAG